MKLFAEIVNGWKPLTIFVKNFHLHLHLGSEYASKFRNILEIRLFFEYMYFLTLSWRRSLSYRNQSIDLLCKSKDSFLYDRGHRHERVKKSNLYYCIVRFSSYLILNFKRIAKFSKMKELILRNLFFNEFSPNAILIVLLNKSM